MLFLPLFTLFYLGTVFSAKKLSYDLKLVIVMLFYVFLGVSALALISLNGLVIQITTFAEAGLFAAQLLLPIAVIRALISIFAVNISINSITRYLEKTLSGRQYKPAGFAIATLVVVATMACLNSIYDEPAELVFFCFIYAATIYSLAEKFLPFSLTYEKVNAE